MIQFTKAVVTSKIQQKIKQLMLVLLQLKPSLKFIFVLFSLWRRLKHDAVVTQQTELHNEACYSQHAAHYHRRTYQAAVDTQHAAHYHRRTYQAAADIMPNYWQMSQSTKLHINSVLMSN